MSLTSMIWGNSQFDEAVDKATSELRLAEEDIALNLEICDQIRSKSVPPKDAARALKRRLGHKNPNVVLLALGLTDVCVKNGGDHFLNEVASKEFMDNLVLFTLKAYPGNIDVRNKALRLVQNWSVAFEGKYTLGYVGQVYKNLKSEGFNFPPKDLTVSNSAMVDTSTAPDWIDSDVCMRCRTGFSLMNRKHHCRNCGQVFDQQCSSKTLSLPHFGITQAVRVCDGCFDKLNKRVRDRERSHSVDFYSSSHNRHSSSRPHRHRSAREFADAELQRAIQLSLEESGSSSGSSHRHSQSYQPSYNHWQTSEPPLVDRGSRPNANGRKREEEEEDPELKAAIEASLREANAPKPSAPVVTPYDEPEEYTYRVSSYTNGGGREREYAPPLPTLPNHDLNPRESDAILTFSQTVQDVRAQGGPDLSRVSNVHEMYDRATGLRPKLAMSLDDTGRKEQMLSEMHDKLSQAVKLYDHLLTEQISHPTWRTASTSQQPYTQTPSRYHTVDGLQRPESAQWSHQQYVTSPRPVEQGYQTVGYGATAPPPVNVQSHPSMQRQSSYTSEYGATNQYAQPQTSDPYQQQPVSAASGPSYQESHPPQQQQPQQAWSQATYAEPPTPQQQQYQPPTPAQEYQPQGQPYQAQGQQYQPQGQPYQAQPQSQYAPPSPAVSQQTHPSIQSPVPPIVQSPAPAPVPQFHYAPPPAQPVQSPPPAQQHQQSYYQSTPTSNLSRHNTYSHSTYASPPPAQASSTTLGRSNTVAYSHPQPQATYAPAPVATSPLPAFPTAPTSNPQAFPMFSPPVSGLEHTEKKEVALIDL